MVLQLLFLLLQPPKAEPFSLGKDVTQIVVGWLDEDRILVERRNLINNHGCILEIRNTKTRALECSHKIPEGWTPVHDHALSPNRKTILAKAYGQPDRIGLFTVHGGLIKSWKATVALEFEYDPVWLPDGTHFVTHNPFNQVLLYDINRRKAVKQVFIRDIRIYRWAGSLPSGNLFGVNVWGNGLVQRQEFSLNRPNSSQTELLETPIEATGSARYVISPDSKRLAWLSRVLRSDNVNVEEYIVMVSDTSCKEFDTITSFIPTKDTGYGHLLWKPSGKALSIEVFSAAGRTLKVIPLPP